MAQRNEDRPFAGVSVPSPDFAGDDGREDPALAEALARYDLDPTTEADVVAALRGTRLMVPLVAVLDEAEEGAGGLQREKSSHMASVSLVSADGRRGLLAFTSVASMAAWDPKARGIPTAVATVVSAALQEEADAVLLDLGGPVRFAVQGQHLVTAARDRSWRDPVTDPEVSSAVRAALEGLVAPRCWRLEHPAVSGAGSSADLLVRIFPDPGVDADALAAEVAERLAADAILAARCPRGIALGLPPVPPR